MTLEQFGYRVVSGEDGPELVALCARRLDDVALAVVDIMMPQLDGPSLLRTLQRLKPGLKLLVMCGSVEKEKVAELIKSPSIRFLIKPFNADELLIAVRDCLEGS